MKRYKVRIYRNHDKRKLIPYVVKYGIMRAVHWLWWEVDIYDMSFLETLRDPAPEAQADLDEYVERLR